MKAIRAVAAAVLFFAAAFVISGLGHILPADWRVALDGAVYFALLGALFGVIISLDRKSGMAVGHHTYWRSFLGGVIGTAAVLHWQWHAAAFSGEALAAGFVVGALLGGLGWTWAWILEYM